MSALSSWDPPEEAVKAAAIVFYGGSLSWDDLHPDVQTNLAGRAADGLRAALGAMETECFIRAVRTDTLLRLAEWFKDEHEGWTKAVTDPTDIAKYGEDWLLMQASHNGYAWNRVREKAREALDGE